MQPSSTLSSVLDIRVLWRWNRLWWFAVLHYDRLSFLSRLCCRKMAPTHSCYYQEVNDPVFHRRRITNRATRARARLRRIFQSVQARNHPALNSKRSQRRLRTIQSLPIPQKPSLCLEPRLPIRNQRPRSQKRNKPPIPQQIPRPKPRRSRIPPLLHPHHRRNHNLLRRQTL